MTHTYFGYIHVLRYISYDRDIIYGYKTVEFVTGIGNYNIRSALCASLGERYRYRQISGPEQHPRVNKHIPVVLGNTPG